GQGESSKTTFLKQRQSLYAHDISLDDCKVWQNIIYDNLTSTLRLFVKFHKQCSENIQQEPFPKALLTKAIETRVEELYDAIDAGIGEQLPSDFSFIFRSLYGTPTFQTALHACQVNQVPSNLQYYLMNLERLCAQDFLPDDEDILHTRVRTTGISNIVLDSHAHAEKNRMGEAFMLFESVANSHYFTKSRMILCFTRMDVFEKKLRSGATRVQEHITGYYGPPTDPSAVKEYFADKFAELLRNRDMDIHYLDATD
ncbi:hypothetical protein K458DRAFT_280688, partial [Lentithecium fluviatile CBS 122367]